MAKNKERKLKNNFKFDEGNVNYDFQLKKKPNLWWLLLLLLPLMLFIPLKKDIALETYVNGKAEPFVDVSMNYTAHYLLWNKQFFAKVPYDTIQQTDSTGCTVFKDLGFSVYSYIFKYKNSIVFSAVDDCFDSVVEQRCFHVTHKVRMDMSPVLTDVRLKVVDKELGFELPGASVECEYYGKHGSQHTNDTTDAAGCVVIKEMRLCGGINSIKVSADGYADTLLTDKSIEELLEVTGGFVIPLRPLKARFIFFVKNKYIKDEPVPDALAEVTLTLNGKIGVVGHTRTNVDGLGQGFYENAREKAKINISASKDPHYKPGKLEGDYTVRQFVDINLPDSCRVIWLEPDPYTVQFRNVDTLSGQPVSGVRNEIVINGIDGITRNIVRTSNRNGYFPVTAMAGDKIIIVSTKDPYYHPNTTIIDKFEKDEIVYMHPVLVTLDFRTLEVDKGMVTDLLPACDLDVTVDGKKVNPTNSGTGAFSIPNLRLTSHISIVASKQGYETNDTKIRNKNVEFLAKTPQSERDIPLEKYATLVFRTVEMVDGSVVGLLPDCDLIVTIDGRKVNPTSSGYGEFKIENISNRSTISIIASKQYYDSNDTKVRNRNVGDLNKASQDQRDIPLGIHCVCGKKYKSADEEKLMQAIHLHVMGKPSGRFKFMFETLPWPDELEIWNCRPEEIKKGGKCLWKWTLKDGVNHNGRSGHKGDGSPTAIWLDYSNGPYITVVSTRSEMNSYYNYIVCCLDEDCDWPQD